MTNPFIKNATLPRNSRMEWIALDQGQGPMIARLTLVELAAALGATPDELVAAPAAAPHEVPLVARLADLPALAEVGNVAILGEAPGKAVGVARIGQESFVAFAKGKSEGEIVALSATLDPSSERLTIGGGTSAH
jgi:hypothetical protein